VPGGTIMRWSNNMKLYNLHTKLFSDELFWFIVNHFIWLPHGSHNSTVKQAIVVWLLRLSDWRISCFITYVCDSCVCHPLLWQSSKTDVFLQLFASTEWLVMWEWWCLCSRSGYVYWCILDHTLATKWNRNVCHINISFWHCCWVTAFRKPCSSNSKDFS